MFGRKKKPEKVVAELVEAGAPPDTADAIVQALLQAGMTASEAHDWLVHPELAYGHDWPMEIAGDTMILKAGSRFLIEQGHGDQVLAAAREVASATEDERTISYLFSGNIGRVRAMTGGDPQRTAVIAEIGRTLLARVGSPDNVNMVGQTKPPGDGEPRLVDRLIAGEEQAVRDELASGALDPRAFARDGELIFTGW